VRKSQDIRGSCLTGSAASRPFREYIHIIHARFRGEEVGLCRQTSHLKRAGGMPLDEREKANPKLLGDIDFDMDPTKVY